MKFMKKLILKMSLNKIGIFLRNLIHTIDKALMKKIRKQKNKTIRKCRRKEEGRQEKEGRERRKGDKREKRGG